MTRLSRRMASSLLALAPLVLSGPAAAASRDRASREATLRAFYGPFSGGSADIHDRILTPTWIEHPARPEAAPGPAAYKQVIGYLRQASPDLRIEVQDVLVDGDKGAVRSLLSAVHSTPLFGFAPTGRPFQILTMDLHRFEGEQIAETWHVEDWLDAFRQSGALPNS